MTRPFLRFAPVLALLLGAIVGCVNNDPARSTDPEKSRSGDPAASASAGNITVQEIRAGELEKAIKDQKGKVILIDCWATWCPPCVASFPHLVERHKKYADQGLVCMSLSMDKLGAAESYSKDKVLAFLSSKGATFQNLIVGDPRQDGEQLMKLLGDFSYIPYMVMFDRTGRRVWTSDERPRLSETQIDLKIESLLADRP